MFVLSLCFPPVLLASTVIFWVACACSDSSFKVKKYVRRDDNLLISGLLVYEYTQNMAQKKSDKNLSRS